MNAPFPFADGQFGGGQPSPEQLAQLAREGVRTVVNLRGPDEAIGYDEAAEAARLGLRYVTLPVTPTANANACAGSVRRWMRRAPPAAC